MARHEGPAGMQLRQAGSDDAPALVVLVNRAYRPAEGQAGWTHESALVSGDRIDLDAMTQVLAQAASSVLVLASHDGLLGCVHVQREGDAAHIGMLAVDPAAQASGLGKHLLEAAEAHALERFAVRRFVLTVVSAREELINFYLRRGYRRAGGHAAYPLQAGAGIPREPGLTIEQLEKAARADSCHEQ